MRLCPSANTLSEQPTRFKVTPRDKPSIGHIVIPYTQGLGESIKKICSEYGIHTDFKGNGTFTQLLVKPKDQNPMDRRSGAIYMYQCGEIMCNEDYIGGNIQDPGGKLQGESEGTLSHPCAQHLNWSQYHT